MLYTELESAWKAAAEEFNADIRASRPGTGAYGTVPAELKPWEYHFLMRLYARDEFDGILTGAARHHIFARWACYQYGAWSRVIERERQKLYVACESAAGTFTVTIPEAFRRGGNG